MKLVRKFVLLHLLLSLIVMSLGGVFYYIIFTELVDKETDHEMNGQVNHLSKLIKKGIPYHSLEDHSIQIHKHLDTTNLKKSRVYLDTLALHRPSKAIIHHRKIRKTREINGDWYTFQIHESVVEPEDTFYGTFKATSAIFLLLATLSIALGFLISRSILKPFDKTLQEIKEFNIRNASPITRSKYNTHEFDQLNKFINKMSLKAINDYKNLKEFSENIAHEIRTPLAIASSNLDLLFQKQHVGERELESVTKAQVALNKVSKIQQSLITLSKIENHEFDKKAKVNLSQLITNQLSEHEDILQLKKIAVHRDINPGFYAHNDPTLVEILFNNLLQNAIKHNLDKEGYIQITLTEKYLEIANSGQRSQVPPEDLLKRFKKEGEKNDSVGLGLSIVKKICDMSGYDLKYEQKKDQNVHLITINFQQIKNSET